MMFKIIYFFNEGNFCAVVCCIMFQLGTTSVSLPVEGLYPSVGMHSVVEEVQFFLVLNWIPEEYSLMSVDTNEDEWNRLNGIQPNGQVCCQHCCR
jgi:hypothetical protein